MQKNHDPVMVDLETLGTGANSLILSIGAVKFDPDAREITDSFYLVVNKQSCLDVGMVIDPATEKWWSEQSPEAQKVLKQAEDPNTSEPIKDVLEKFAKLFTRDTCLWGNGSDFDNAMLQEAYRKIGVKQPWAFWNNRCYRTMKNLVPDVPFKRIGTYHNAVDDAATQAYHLMDILKKLRG